MSNPFDDDGGTFVALINDEGQYSLWPTFADVPDGWQIVCGPGDRDTCWSYIEAEWTDMRPKSLIAAMETASESRPDV
jgi:MbtH protein